MGKVSKIARDRWYRDNKVRQIAEQLRRRKVLLAELLTYKKTLSCRDCGFSFQERPECCDFHHPDPAVKDGSIRAMCLSSARRMWAEIKKCIPLCANCHRTVHRRK